MSEGVCYLSEGVGCMSEGACYLSQGVCYLCQGVCHLSEGGGYLSEGVCYLPCHTAVGTLSPGNSHPYSLRLFCGLWCIQTYIRNRVFFLATVHDDVYPTPPGPIFHGRYLDECRYPKRRLWKHLARELSEDVSFGIRLAPSWLSSNRAWKPAPGGG